MVCRRFRITRSTLGVALLIGALALLMVAPAGASAETPRCAGQQRFVGNLPQNAIQVFFNCNEAIKSFRVNTSKSVAPVLPPAVVERNGVSEPPPQGFTCIPNAAFPHSFTCGGQADKGNLVRDHFATQANPCAAPAMTTTVTVGTGMPDASGNPTGRKATFSLGALRGCRVAIPPGGTCRGEQFFGGNVPPNRLQILFNCNRTIQSFRLTVSKPLAPPPLDSTIPAAVERNGVSQPPPQGFFCSPNGGFPKSETCGGLANSGNLVRKDQSLQLNPCEPVTTTVTVGTGLPDPRTGNPTGTLTTFSLGPLQGCALAIPKPPPPPPPPPRCHPTGDANTGVSQGQSLGGDSAANQGALAQQNAGSCR